MQSRCESCGAPSDGPGETCSWCGARLSDPGLRRCLGCGTLTDDPGGVCMECFKTLRASRPQPPPAVAPAPPPAGSPCRGCGMLTERPSGLCAECASPQPAAPPAPLAVGDPAHPKQNWRQVLGIPEVYSFRKDPNRHAYIVVGLIIGGLLWMSYTNRPVPPPPGSMVKPPKPTEYQLAASLKPDDMVVLTNARVWGAARDPVSVYATPADFERGHRALSLEDEELRRQALALAYPVEQGTRARIVISNPARLLAEVRILEGQRKGKEFWLSTTRLQP